MKPRLYFLLVFSVGILDASSLNRIVLVPQIISGDILQSSIKFGLLVFFTESFVECFTDLSVSEILGVVLRSLNLQSRQKLLDVLVLQTVLANLEVDRSHCSGSQGGEQIDGENQLSPNEPGHFIWMLQEEILLLDLEGGAFRIVCWLPVQDLGFLQQPAIKCPSFF